MPASFAHEAIYDTVEQIFRDLPKGTVLDVPSGEGALAIRLAEMGYDVRCCDLYPEIFRLPEVEIKKGDLNSSLPYEDRSFDHIVCIEGLEHIENPHQAFREFQRLIRPGGRLVVSVPNILNIEERLKWLFFGYTSHFKPLTAQYLTSVSQKFSGTEEVALHVNPISYSELRYLIEKYGFEIAGVYRDKPKRNSWLYLPIVALIRIVNGLQSGERRSARWSAELQSGEILLGGNTLVIEAVRL